MACSKAGGSLNTAVMFSLVIKYQFKDLSQQSLFSLKEFVIGPNVPRTFILNGKPTLLG